MAKRKKTTLPELVELKQTTGTGNVIQVSHQYALEILRADMKKNGRLKNWNTTKDWEFTKNELIRTTSKENSDQS